MKVLSIIPARGGSKGIPKKNIVDLNGKPLIQYTVEAAKHSQKIDKVFLSSDDHEIINVVKQLGVYSEYIRPKELASDTASSVEAVLHALKWLEKNENYIPDAIMILQPTSPLRIVDDIDNAIELFVNDSKKCLVSIHEMIEHPYECIRNPDKDDWQYLANPDVTVTRRQDYNDKFYYINGSVYLVDTEFFKKNKVFIQENNTNFYIMPHERGIDIDEYTDLKKAEFMLKEKYYEN